MNDDMLSPQSLSIEPPRRDRITAISAAVQRRPILLVVGMHRSGTSLCSHLLSALGVDMTDKIPGPGLASPSPDNPRGHWERWEIVEFHDRILRMFNRDYLGRFHDFALPVAWWADPRVAQIRREIVAFLEQRMGDGYFGFKDPRTVRLMPVWHQIFNELKLAPKIVLCLRNPGQIGRSLNARDGLDPEIGEYRWLVHMIDFFRYTRNFDFCTVEYEEWFNNPSANLEKLQEFLDLQWQQSEADLALVLSGIIDPTARHDDSNHREPSQPLVRTLYKLASHAGQDGARDQIAYIVSQFVSFQQLQRPFLQVFEDVARTAANYPEIEQEAASLRALVGERDAGIAAAELRANAAEAGLADALAEIEVQRAHIAELARANDERGEIEREASSLKATIAERDTAVAELSHRADELLAALRTAQAEAAAREAALRHAEQEAQERGAAAEAMQSEIATLRDALAQAERDEQEHAAETAAAQDEIAALEQEAEERAAAAEAMQSEIAALRDALAQAERDEQEHAAETAAAQDEIAALEQEAEERGAAAAAMEAEVATLRDALVQADREAQKSGATAEVMQAEVAALWDTLVQAEPEAQQREAAAVAMQGELAALRGRLTRAEGEARERAVAAAALQAEIVTLQSTLTAAREVGKAAIAAFRIDTVAPTKPDRPRGWRQAVMRLFGTRTSV
jgi:hypothetical protein